MRDESPGASLGLLDSLKRLAASLLAISYTRLELLSTELEENRERLVSTLVLLLIALFCLGVGVVLITILLVVAFWDGYRLQALGGIGVVFLAAGGAAWGFAAYKMKSSPRLFASSLAELSKDRQHLVQRP
jgi:uncharacterized membrane protein YqjE